jgi:threonine dehydratase
MFPIARTSVERVMLVSDDAIRAAQDLLWDKLRITVEPGGAAAFAAVSSRVYQPAAGENIGVVLCGANLNV